MAPIEADTAPLVAAVGSGQATTADAGMAMVAAAAAAEVDVACCREVAVKSTVASALTVATVKEAVAENLRRRHLRRHRLLPAACHVQGTWIQAEKDTNVAAVGSGQAAVVEADMALVLVVAVAAAEAVADVAC